jgi:hypothetical protein
MKTVIYLLAFSFFVNAFTSPCDDSIYLELSKKPVADMTQGEATYFTGMKQQCNEFQIKENEKQEAMRQEKQGDLEREQKYQEIKGKVGAWVLFSVMVAVAVGFTSYFIISQK